MDLSKNPVKKSELLSAIEIALYKHGIDQKLKESEEKYRSIIENINDVVFSIDERGLITFASSQIIHLFGYTPEEVIGRGFPEFIFEDDIQKTVEGFNSIKKNEMVSNEYRIKHKSGELIWVMSSSRPIFKDGKFAGINGIINNIDEKKKTEEVLVTSEERYRLLFEDSPISLWEEDLSGVKIFIDRLRKKGIKDLKKYFQKNPDKVQECISSIGLVDINKATLNLYKAKNKSEMLKNYYKVFTPETLFVIKEAIIKLSQGEMEYEGYQLTKH